MDTNEEISRHVLEQESHPKLHSFYQACLNVDVINKRGRAPLMPAWNIIDQIASDSKQDLVVGIGELNYHGIFPFFNFGSVIDSENPGYMIAQFGQGGLILGDESLYLDSDYKELLGQYKEHITKMFAILQVPNPDQWATSVLNIEIALAKITVPADKLTNPFTTYNKFTYEKFLQLTDNLPWGLYFDSLGIPKSVLKNVLVDVPSFMTGLASILNDTEKDWIPYLKWQLLTNEADLLDQPLRDEHFRFFNKILRGQKEPQPRWKECVEATDGSRRTAREILGANRLSRRQPKRFFGLAKGYHGSYEARLATFTMDG